MDRTVKDFAHAIRRGEAVEWDIKTWTAACYIAEELAREERGPLPRTWLPTDAGPHCWPRYGVTAVPQVGAPVSRYFNGDSYICGHVVSVSKTHRVVTTKTEDGRTYRFHRRRLTGAWVEGGMWSLVPGHHEERNPHL